MRRNLGQSSLRRRRRPVDPMAAFDQLPAPLRQWMAQAARPWSAASAMRIWTKLQAKGLSQEDMLTSLAQAEAATLARDRQSIAFKQNSMT